MKPPERFPLQPPPVGMLNPPERPPEDGILKPPERPPLHPPDDGILNPPERRPPPFQLPIEGILTAPLLPLDQLEPRFPLQPLLPPDQLEPRLLFQLESLFPMDEPE